MHKTEQISDVAGNVDQLCSMDYQAISEDVGHAVSAIRDWIQSGVWNAAQLCCLLCFETKIVVEVICDCAVSCCEISFESLIRHLVSINRAEICVPRSTVTLHGVYSISEPWP